MPRLTYANVTATLALFIALGGGAYAATALPKNSVGTAQIKKNAVTGAKIKSSAVASSDVKDGSLLKKDFKAGELPAGPAGAKGDKGDPGANGTNGTTGPRGPSNGFESGNNASPTYSATEDEDSIALPAGSFIVFAKADVENSGAAGAGTVTCRLEVGGFPLDSSTVKLPTDGANDDDTFALHAGVNLATAGNVAFDCTNSGGAPLLTNVKMNAIQVETNSFEEIV